MITQCSFCKKIRQANGKFVPQEIPADAQISHTYCPRCEVLVRAPMLIRRDGFMRALAKFAHEIFPQIQPAKLEVADFTPNLVDGGFALKFDDGARLSLLESADDDTIKFEYRERSESEIDSGELSEAEDQKTLRWIFDYITSMLEPLTELPAK